MKKDNVRVTERWSVMRLRVGEKLDRQTANRLDTASEAMPVIMVFISRVWGNH